MATCSATRWVIPLLGSLCYRKSNQLTTAPCLALVLAGPATIVQLRRRSRKVMSSSLKIQRMTSAAKMPQLRHSHLPRELVDEVISYLSDDRMALESCAFVSKTFLDSSRRYLLAETTFTISKADGFTHILSRLSRHAHLTKFITRLNIVGRGTTVGRMFPYEHISHAVSDNLHNGKRSDPGPACVVTTCILPDRLWELLPNLQCLSLSFVWIAHNEVLQHLGITPLDSIHGATRRERQTRLRRLNLRWAVIWNPVDVTFAEMLSLLQPQSIHFHQVNSGTNTLSGWRPYPVHTNTVSHVPILRPVDLGLSSSMMRPCYLDMLARTMARDALTSVVLFENLTTQGCDIHDLGLFLAPAQSTLTHLHVHALPELEENMWSAIDLHSFIKLREVTVRFVLLCPLDLNGKAHWAQLTSFLHHLPIGSIERLTINVSVTLTPECYLNNSIEPGFERVPEEVKSSFDPAFKRLLPTLKLCEFIWRPDACFDIDTSIYFNQWQMLIPSLTEAGIVHLKHEPFNPYK